MQMSIIKAILDWTAAIAWPAAVLTIALIYRKPIYSLLSNVGGIASRAATQPFEFSLGSFKVDFKEAVIAKNPKSVDEAISIAADVAKESLSIYDTLRSIPLTENQRDVLRDLVTPAGMRRNLTLAELRSRYPQKDVDDLLSKNILVVSDTGVVIAHDLIAGFVRKEFR